jgi:hypothetical protein
LVLILALFVLSGCATNGGRGSRILPWNWFAPDHSTQLQTAQGKTGQAEDALVKQAQIENAKTVEALRAAPQADRAVQVASRTAANAQQLLDRAAGPVKAEDLQALHETVKNLLSENADLRATGEHQQAAAEQTQTKLANALDAAREREATLTAKLQESDLRYQAEAEKHRRLWFYVYAIAGTWIALQLLAGIARFYPALQPVARIAGMVSAPAVQAGYERLTHAVGEAISNAEKVSTATAEMLRQHLDGPMDAGDQNLIREKYLKAP